DEPRFNIVAITRLDDLKNRVVKGIALSMSTTTFNQNFVDMLREHARSSTTDHGELRLNLYDPKLNRGVSLTAQQTIPVNKQLIEMLESENIQYSIIKQ
ncbi:MAG: hypothetical protein K2J09_00115, partial [Muribaculaceae bacterium]|nr:hypothetical protein [Muribaculaceae bacterium]